MPSGGQGLIYICQSIQHEPLDQTDLRNGIDATYKAVENRHCNTETDRWAQGPGGLQVGLGGPTCQPLTLRFNVESSRVFWNLLVSVSLWISAIKSDM